MGLFRLSMAEVGRTTQIIGELIALITEQEETLTLIGREGYALYKKNRVFDEVTLELCRKVDGTRELIQQKREELEDAIEDKLAGTVHDSGAREAAKRLAIEHLQKRDLEHYERMLRTDYDELGNRILWMSSNEPTALTARILRLSAAMARLKRDVDWRWEELQERTRNERKGPVFILVLNMFVINFFKFTNHMWFRRWIRDMQFFKENVMDRIHRQVQSDLRQAAEEAPEPEPVPASPDPFKPPPGVKLPAAEPPSAAGRRPDMRGWSAPRSTPEVHNAPADAAGGAFGPAAQRPRSAPEEPPRPAP